MAFSVFHAGAEQQVNSIVTDNQTHPDIIALPDGWLVTWTGQDSDDSGVYMQKYDLQGVAQFTAGGLPSDRLVNSNPVGAQLFSTATTLTDGGWVISWLQSDGALVQQRFAANGDRVEGEEVVNQSGSDLAKHVSMASHPDGGWFVTWHAFDGDGWGIFQQRHDAAGDAQLPVGGQRVNASTIGHQKNAQITVLTDDPLDPDDGGWVVTWVGTPDTQTQPSDPGANVYMRRYKADGTTDGADVVVSDVTQFNQSAPDIVALSDGGWVVVWQSQGQDGSDAGIFLQRFDKFGIAAFEDDQQVNQEFQGDQRNPRITVLEDGSWIVTWESVSTWDVFQRRFHPDGTPAGSEVRIADGHSASIYNTNATVIPTAGGWVVAWQTVDQDATPGSGISQRVFTFGPAQLTTGVDFAGGTAIGEILQVAAGGLSDGDMIDGGDGDDTLEILEAGTLDFSLPRQFKSIEIIQGSDGNDVLIMNAEIFNGFGTIDGGDGTDEIQFYTSDTYDLTSKTLVGIERISLSDFGNVVLVDDAATALLLAAGATGNRVEIASGALSLDERIQIFKNGIDVIVHDGTTYTKSAPVIGGLNGDEVTVDAGASVRLDSGIDADVTSAIGRFETLKVVITNRVAGQDRLELVEGNGLTIVDDAVLFNGTQIGTLDEVGNLIEITFDADADSNAVQTVLRALAYENTASGNAVNLARTIEITLVGADGSSTSVNTVVQVEDVGPGGNKTPQIFGVTNPANGFDTGLISPFAQVRVVDDDAQFTVTVAFDKTKGSLIVPAGTIHEYDAATGTYTFTAYPDDLTTTLRALQFDPRDRPNQPVGTSEVTRFTIVVTDGSGAHADATVDVTSVTANRQPEKLVFTGGTVSELATTGTVVGKISAVDPNGDNLTYSLLGAEGTPFELVGGEIRVTNGVAVDFEQKQSYSFTMRATDAGGLSIDQRITINVRDVAAETTAGSTFNDRIKGGAGVDNLAGGAGDDVLFGGLANDTLTGNGGIDIFVFDTKLHKSKNVDRIVDFVAKDDAVWLDNSVFTKVGSGTPDKPVKLAAKAFFAGTKAHDADDRIIYDKKAGVLYYDADGTGSAAQVKFATVKKNTTMSVKDFFVI